MDKSLIRSLCSGTVADSRAEVQEGQVEKTSVTSYLQGGCKVPVHAKISDAQGIRKVSCRMFSMTRRERRVFLSRVSDSTRRRLLVDNKIINRMISDGVLGYDPELSWALEEVIVREGRDSEAQEILEKRYSNGTLPEEVSDWWEGYVSGSPKVEELEKRLKPFAYSDSCKKPVKDDTRVDEFLESGKEQEGEINEIIEEGVERGTNLSEEANEILSEVESQVEEQAKEFASSVIEAISSSIPELAKEEAQSSTEELVEDVIEDDPKEEALGSITEEEEGDASVEDGFKFSSSVGDSVQVVTSPEAQVSVSQEGGVQRVEVIEVSSKEGYPEGVSEETFEMLDTLDGGEEFDESISEGLSRDEFSDEVKVTDAKIPAKLVTLFKEGQNLNVPLKLEDVSIGKSKLGMGKYFVDLTFDEDIPNDLKGSVEGAIQGYIKKNLPDVATKAKRNWFAKNKIRLTIGDSISSISSPREIKVGDKVIRQGSKVEYEGSTYYVVSIGEDDSLVLRLITSPKDSDLVTISKDKVAGLKVFDPLTKVKDDSSEEVYDVMYDWCVTHSSELATNSVYSEVEAAMQTLSDNLSSVDDRFSMEGMSVTYTPEEGSPALFAEYKNSSLSVGGTLFLFQTSDTGIQGFAQGAAARSQELYEFLTTNNTYEVEDEFEDEEVLKDSLSTIRDSKRSSRFVTIQDSEGEFVVVFTDVLGRDKVYLSEEGVVKDVASAKRFTSSREAFDFMRALQKEGKLLHSIYNSYPLPVQDDAEGKSVDELADQALQSIEDKIVERLKKAGVEIEDSHRSGEGLISQYQEVLSSEDVNHMAEVYRKGMESLVDDFKDADELSEAFKVLVKLGVASGVIAPPSGRGVTDALSEEEVLEKIREAEGLTKTNLSEEEKESGDYPKGEVTIQGMDICIENPKGSIRSGVDRDGNAWSTEMKNTYGYFKDTKSSDKDEIDVFIGEHPLSDKVYVVDQVRPESGEFDEVKVMLGFEDSESARNAYLSNYEEGWEGLGNITEVPLSDFRKWVNSGRERKKPFTEYLKLQDSCNVRDTMNPNEDGDDRITLNWDVAKLQEYLDKIKNRRLSKEEAKELGIEDCAKLTEDEWVEYERQVKDALSGHGVNLRVASPRKGSANRYDISHNAKTFHDVRDTASVLDSILSLVSKEVGKDVSNFQDDAELSARVSDSAFMLGELDLFCPSLYKRKFTDKVWVSDCASEVGEAFGIEIPEGKESSPVLVSNVPFSSEAFRGYDVEDEQYSYPLSGDQELRLVFFRA